MAPKFKQGKIIPQCVYSTYDQAKYQKQMAEWLELFSSKCNYLIPMCDQETSLAKRPVSMDFYFKLAVQWQVPKMPNENSSLFFTISSCHGQIIPYLLWSPSKCRRLFCVSKIEFLLKNEVTKL